MICCSLFHLMGGMGLGLPVYYETTIFQGLPSSIVADASYGTDSFKQLTKMKSRVVLRILKMGVNAMWTDCDIVWFKNPLPYLHTYKSDLVIQTNAPDSEPMNGKRRINSGFYLAKSNQPTIQVRDILPAKQGLQSSTIFSSRSVLLRRPAL